MKTFFNVLYRRILYKIPLKFLLILLAVFAILFASFSNASFSNGYNGNYIYYSNFNNGNYIQVDEGQNFCFKIVSQNNGNNYLYNCQYSGQDYNTCIFLGRNFAGTDIGNIFCYYNSGYYYLRNDWNSNGNTYEAIVFTPYTDCPICSSCDYSGYLTQSECNNLYSGYILESSINSAYCENNLLCSSSSSGDFSWSALYINNIQHIGGPNIYIDIPEEYYRDYNYSDNDDMFINIEGYNVDYDKIEGIINTQNYKPTQEDFNNIIGILADYMPIIVIFLGLLFIYSMIKKPFKSKLK